MEFGIMKPETDNSSMVKIEVLDPINDGIGDITAGDTTAEQAQETAEQLPNFLVAVEPSAPSCCIDGRHCKHTLAQNEADKYTSPRASVAGGADVTAFAAAEMVGSWFAPDDNRSPQERLADVDVKLRSGGIIPGSHGDETAKINGFKDSNTGDPKTGCGADDKLKDILNRPFDHNESVTKYSGALLGEAQFRSEHMIFETKEQIQERVKDWNPVEALRIVTEKSDGKNAEILEGSHAEILVVFNYNNNSTIDRDAFVETTGKQVFVVDMWYIDKMARAMADGYPDATEMYSKLKHAMVAYQIATYLTLCDGTQRPVLLTPKEDLVSAE